MMTKLTNATSCSNGSGKNLCGMKAYVFVFFINAQKFNDAVQ